MTFKPILAVVTLALPPLVLCQPAAVRPDIRVGDSWEFSRTTSRPELPSTWSRTVTAQQAPDRYTVTWESGKSETYDGALNWLPTTVPRILVQYPLKVGDSWKFSVPLPNNPNWGEEGVANVAALEKITVPAGDFDCYRIEYESTSGTRNYKEQRLFKRWYCPSIKWIAKEIVATRTTK